MLRPVSCAARYSAAGFPRARPSLGLFRLPWLLPLALVSAASWAQGAARLETVTVRSAGDIPLERPASTGSRLELSARDTPASVEVVTRAQLEAKGDTALIDAITRSTAITSLGHPGNSASCLSARGFTDTTSIMRVYDGTRQYGGVGVSFPFDTWSIERIEVLRGPASVAERYALFAADRLELSERWSSVGGLRHEHADLSRQDLVAGSQAFDRSYSNTGWRLGTVYKLDAQTSIYAQLSKAADPVSGLLMLSAANAAFGVSTGKQLQVGIKQSFRQGKGD